MGREGAERPLWVGKEDSLQWGSGPQIGLLELCIDDVSHGCTLQEQHRRGLVPLSCLFLSMNFPGKDA